MSTHRLAGTRCAALLIALGCAAPANGAALAPGMFELRHQHADGYEQQNFALWTPGVTGGGGRIAPKQGEVIDYGNLGVSTAPMFDARGEALLMAGFVDTGGAWSDEEHGEYRWRVDGTHQLAIGGGTSRVAGSADYGYAKLGLRRRGERWQVVTYLTASAFEDAVSPGFYAALHDERYFAGGELHDDRNTLLLGYTSSARGAWLRPALEYFSFDRALGRVDGAEYLAAAATLRFHDYGYFTMPSRLGRALGPAGMQLSNPIGFLLPTWNRRADSWEVGRLLSAGYREFRPAPGLRRARDADVVLFPADVFDRSPPLAKQLFIGAAWRDEGGRQRTAPLLGLHCVTPRLTLSAVWQGRSDFTVNLQIPWQAFEAR